MYKASRILAVFGTFLISKIRYLNHWCANLPNLTDKQLAQSLTPPRWGGLFRKLLLQFNFYNKNIVFYQKKHPVNSLSPTDGFIIGTETTGIFTIYESRSLDSI